MKLLIDREEKTTNRQPPKVGDYAMWMRANSKITKVKKLEIKRTSLGNFEQYEVEVEHLGRFIDEYNSFKFTNAHDYVYVGLNTDK